MNFIFIKCTWQNFNSKFSEIINIFFILIGSYRVKCTVISNEHPVLNPYWQNSRKFLRPFYWKTRPSKNYEYLFNFLKNRKTGSISFHHKIIKRVKFQIMSGFHLRMFCTSIKPKQHPVCKQTCFRKPFVVWQICKLNLLSKICSQWLNQYWWRMLATATTLRCSWTIPYIGKTCQYEGMVTTKTLSSTSL